VFLVTATRQTQISTTSLLSDVSATTPLRLPIAANKDLVIGHRPRRQRKPSAKKIIKDVKSSGLDVRAVKIAPDGTITVEIGKADEQANGHAEINPWDEVPSYGDR
jgi:hypothetical protein